MDGNTQNYTETQNDNGGTVPTIVQPAAEGEVFLTAQQDYYISYLAVGGLVPDEGGPGHKVKAADFAASIGVSRETLYYWRKHIPGLWERVAARRKELFGKDRLAQVWNGIYLKAAAGNPQAAALYLANFDDDFRMPTEKHEIEAGGGFMDLLQRMRQAQARQPRNVDATPEGAVINDDTNQKQPANIA